MRHFADRQIVLTLALGFMGVVSARAEEPPAEHHHLPMAAMEAVPGESIYQLPISLQTAEGHAMALADLRGQPVLITMFYSHCTSICPLLTAQLQRLVAALSPAERQRLHVLMVSFDVQRDTPEALTAFKAEHRIEDPQWIIARASADDVRVLAAALGIRYRQLADGTFNHSALVSLADREGIVRARSSELSQPEAGFVHALHAQVAVVH